MIVAKGGGKGAGGCIGGVLMILMMLGKFGEDIAGCSRGLDNLPSPRAIDNLPSPRRLPPSPSRDDEFEDLLSFREALLSEDVDPDEWTRVADNLLEEDAESIAFLRLDPLNDLDNEEPIPYRNERIVRRGDEPWRGEEMSVRPSIIAVVPRTEDAFNNVFNTTYTVYDQNSMERYSYAFSNLNSHTLSYSFEGSDSFFELLHQYANQGPVLIVGHTDIIQGNKYIVLPSGERVLIDDLHIAASDLNSSYIIISCFSDDLNINRRINMGEAYALANRAMRVFNEARTSGVGDAGDWEGLMVSAMRRELMNRQIKKTSVIVIGVGAVGYGAYYEFSQD